MPLSSIKKFSSILNVKQKSCEGLPQRKQNHPQRTTDQFWQNQSAVALFPQYHFIEADILKIQYLDALHRLEKLQLDNNIIEKIENIDHLTNLKWLDLSFNRITTMEGIDKLTNLTDLTLYNNKITFIDGLYNCTKLNIFSIGNNLIRSF